MFGSASEAIRSSATQRPKQWPSGPKARKLGLACSGVFGSMVAMVAAGSSEGGVGRVSRLKHRGVRSVRLSQ